MKVLVVEDHPSLRGLLADHLVRAGFVVDTAERGKEALAMLGVAHYDAALLDLGLPDMDGMSLLGRLRRIVPDLPCIILTARDALSDRIAGLNAGADDYVLKPFEMTELEARLRAILRRPGARPDTALQFCSLRFEPGTRHAEVCGRGLELARREAMLLEELLRVAPRIVVKDQLEDRLYAFNESASSNAIEALVSRVRRKLEEVAADCRIDTVRGIGYRLQPHG